MACRPTVMVQSKICGALTVSSVISHYFTGGVKIIIVLSGNQNPTCTQFESVSTFT